MTRKNSFDFIRLLAAVFVVFSHSFALTGFIEPHLGTFSLGALGVWIFFILSGYLISKSWDQYPRFNVFFAKRILRIFPGLIMAIVLTIIVVGIFFTSLPLIQYFKNQGTFAYLNNIFLYNTSYLLPGGVFASNPYPGSVNGSIWTLAYEFTMYITVALIGAFKVYKKISALTIWKILFVAVLGLYIIGVQHFNISIFYLNISQFLPLALLFFSGIVMSKEEHRLKLTYTRGFASLIVFMVLAFINPLLLPLYASIFLAYAIFALGKSDKMAWVGKYGDFSYGIYIYSFPVQQMIVATTHTTNSYKLFFLSLLVSLIIAVLSWHLLESRFLRLKSKINSSKYPLPQLDEAW
jgi:peptidoglycan/LPS O-acetylase OafA/YrhL